MIHENLDLLIPTPRWAAPLYQSHTAEGELVRYLGAWGGRGGGKSHEFAGMIVDDMVRDPDHSVVCIREIQKSLALSAKKLIENKIREFGVSHLFLVLKTEIRRIGGTGICIFIGMQDHTADSVKSLEDFDFAWVEEAQSLSQRSMDLLRPTIRKPGSRIAFSWNPRRRADAVERLLRGRSGPRPDAIVVRVNLKDNPFAPETLIKEAESDKITNPDGYAHTWMGDYESVSSKVVIPAMWITSAIGLADYLGLEITGERRGGLDVAGGSEGGDENALALVHGISIRGLDKWNGLDTSLTTTKAVNIAKSNGYRKVWYDADGVGEGVLGEWSAMGRRKEQPEGFTMHPWSGGDKVINRDKRVDPTNKESPLNKDQYHNLKAQAWMSLRRRFENAHKARNGLPYDEDMLVDIPTDLPHLAQLEEELAQPHIDTSATGKTLVDKQPDDSPSPNLGDAVNMAFFPYYAQSSQVGAML